MNLDENQVKPPAIRVQSLEAGYGPTKILRGVSVELAEGEMVVIIGPNGSGKSTLIKSIFGLTQIYSGNIELRGTNVTGRAANEMVRRGVGYVPQAANVFPNLSVHENIQMGAFTLNNNADSQMHAMRELFPILDERWNSPAGHLSGGQRQMLALARALITNPSILLLDEPTAGLAPMIVDEVLQRIKQINASGVAVLLVEQNAVKALKISNRAYVLARGRNIAEDSAKALLDNPEIGTVFLGMGGTGEPEEEQEN